MQRIRQLPAKVKAVILLIAGLVIGAWHSYSIATGSRPALPQSKLIFEILMLLTFIWMLIWTLGRRVKEDHDS